MRRELTKLHEEVWRGSLGEAAGAFADAEVRGEVVIVLGGSSETGEPGDSEVLGSLRLRLAAGNSARDAVSAVAEELGVARRRVYELALSIRRVDGKGRTEGKHEE